MANSLKHYLVSTGAFLAGGLWGAPIGFAQQAGEIIFSEDFGTGVFPTGTPLANGITNFTFTEPAQPADFDPNLPNNGIVDDGFYTIGTNTQQGFSNWADIEDNTPGDVNGLMLIVNARENELVNGEIVEDEFYRQTVTLTANTSFDFLASLVPANSVADEQFCRENEGGLILPNVRFSIQELDGTVIAEIVTGEIPFNAVPAFQQFALRFSTAQSTDDVQIVLSNIAPGGCGNDLAIDDIIFRISVTASAVDDSAEIADASAGQPNILNVASNDMLDNNAFPLPGAPGSTTIVALAQGSVLPPELTFDTATGNVGVVAGADNGVFTFNYIICETSAAVNCDTATVTITVNAPAPPLPPGGGVCPAGQVAVIENGFAVAAFRSSGATVGGASIPELTGPIRPDGTVVPNPSGAARDDPNDGLVDTFGPSIDLDFTGEDGVIVPANSTVTLTLAPFFNNDAEALILASVDGINFVEVPPGQIFFGANAAAPLNERNTIRHFDVVLPAGGARFIRLDQIDRGFRVGGAQRNEICQPAPPDGPQLAATKTVMPLVDESFSVPSEDVLYTITVSNIGDLAVDEDTIFLIDQLPPEVIFFNGGFIDSAGVVSATPVEFTQRNGAALSFDFNRDIAFATGSVPPEDFSDCTGPAGLLAGVNPAVRFICFNPKGVLSSGDPDPTVSFRFRARIN